MNEQEILATLQGWFVEKTGAEADPACRYLEASGIDSFAVIEFIGFIEATFPFRFQTADFQRAEFFSLDGLTRMISEGGNV